MWVGISTEEMKITISNNYKIAIVSNLTFSTGSGPRFPRNGWICVHLSRSSYFEFLKNHTNIWLEIFLGFMSPAVHLKRSRNRWWIIRGNTGSNKCGSLKTLIQSHKLQIKLDLGNTRVTVKKEDQNDRPLALLACAYVTIDVSSVKEQARTFSG